jgi:bifunctional non-homologous end joining protein LigD
MPGRTLFDDLPADARARLRKRTQPSWFPPMLATLVHQAFSREGWLFEQKLDGERCLVFRNGEQLNLFSRNHQLLNLRYPELVEAFQVQKEESFIVDGEIVAFKGGLTSFAKLQQRMQVQQPSAQLRRRVPVWFYAFDLMYLASYDTRQVPCGIGKSCWRGRSTSKTLCVLPSIATKTARRIAGRPAKNAGKA